MKNILVLTLLLISMMSVGQVDIQRHYDDNSVEDYGTTDGEIRLHLDHMDKDVVLYSFMNISLSRLTEMKTVKGLYSVKKHSMCYEYKVVTDVSVITIRKFYNDKTIMNIHMNHQNYSTVYSGNLLLNVVEN